MTDFFGQRTASYNNPKIKMGQGRQPFLSPSQRSTVKELIETLGRMNEATTEAAYHLRKTKAVSLVKRLRLNN